MIRHVFMWQLSEPGDKEQVNALLQSLSEKMPMLQSWELGEHEGEPNENGDPWDGALITDFATWEDLDSYSTDPYHAEVVEQILPLVKSRAVVDFTRRGDV